MTCCSAAAPAAALTTSMARRVTTFWSAAPRVDHLKGGADDDVLIGAGGVDQLTGGTGADHFVFMSVTNSTVGTPDTILDFEENVLGELIDLSRIDANTSMAGDQVFGFAGATEHRFGKFDQLFHERWKHDSSKAT